MSPARCKKEPYDKEGLKKIGAYLHHLHVQRKWADYTLNRDMHRSDAETVINIAKEAMDKIQSVHEEVYPPPAA